MTLQVIDAGGSLLVEDLGRAGWAHLGVPPSGALDPDALALANRLVGNAPDAAGLELLLGGVELLAETSVRVAVTGAELPITVDGRAAPWGEPVSVRRGQRLRLGTVRAGLRSWVAVRGGIAVPPVLGSRSTDTLSGLGPAAVRAGDELPVGEAPGGAEATSDGPSGAAGAASSPAAAAGGGAWRRGSRDADPVCELTYRLGPRDDWFSAESIEAAAGQRFVVSASSNRVALRLDPVGHWRLDRRPDRKDAELPSEGIVTGAVQVPGSGRLVVFMADHPVTGGYPVFAVLDPESVAACAQLRPGEHLRLAPASR